MGFMAGLPQTRSPRQTASVLAIALVISLGACEEPPSPAPLPGAGPQESGAAATAGRIGGPIARVSKPEPKPVDPMFTQGSGTRLSPSSRAKGLLAALRSRANAGAVRARAARRVREGIEQVAPLPAGLADRFYAVAGGLRPELAPGSSGAGAITARLLLPERALAPFRIEDTNSGMSIDVALANARDVVGAVADGYVVYPKGHASGATVLHRATANGIEDYLTFDAQPRSPVVEYKVNLRQGVSGLHLVAGTLELLDAGGAPRLRVLRPFIVGADGVRTEATLAVEGCAVDTSSVLPWGRPITSPGARSCTVRVDWTGRSVAYPATLDPPWTTTGSMAVARLDHSTTLLSNGKVLAAGGRSSNTSTTGLPSGDVYDPTSKTWSPVANSMSGGRYFHSAVQLPTSSNPSTSGMVVLAGGHNGTGSSGFLNTTLFYSPATNMFSNGPNLNVTREQHTATLLSNGQILITGGTNNSAAPTNTAALYNPTSGTGTWTATAGTMASARRFHTATRLVVPGNAGLNNKVLVVGGNSGSASAVSAQTFDFTAGWSAGTSLNLSSAREGHTATALTNGNVLITGGRNGSTTLNTTLLFTAMSGSGAWGSAGTMTAPRQAHSATLLPVAPILTSGQVLVVGGAGGQGGATVSVGTAELWDGTSWSATQAMASAVQEHGAALLPNNRVLVAGGRRVTGAGGSGTTTLAEAQLYDPSLGIACSTGTQCASGFCVNGVCCDSACNGGCGACNLSGKVGTCSPVTSGTSCRSAVGVCDVAEVCNGTALNCPADGFAAATTVCRAPAAGGCDVAENCSGNSATCPTDLFAPTSTVCRAAAAGGCDVAENCPGNSANCPANVFAPTTTVCRAAAAGGCDLAESCPGNSANCPTDVFAPTTTVCRAAAAGGCDIAENCPGNSATCPANVFAPTTTVCRAAVAGGCDVAENCPGNNATCPTDVFAASTTVCRAAVPGGCDVVEKCTGSSNACPADAVASSTTVCRAAVPGGCDVEERCTGSSNACPGDTVASATTVCRAAVSGGCDVEERCTGSSNACPGDTVASSTTVCRAAAGECDAAETCTGISTACPADSKKTNGTACADDGFGCTTDLCDGSLVTCVHALATAGTQCRAAVGTCDVAETCDGGSPNCPADVLATNGTTCNDGRACTQSDLCQSGICVGSAGSCSHDLPINAPPNFLLLTTAWSSGNGDVYVSGYNAMMFHRHADGSTALYEIPGASGVGLVWGPSPTDVYMVSVNKIFHSSGNDVWTNEVIPGAEALGLVWGSSSSDLYAVQPENHYITPHIESKIFHRQPNGQWLEEPLPVTGPITAIRGTSATDVYVTGYDQENGHYSSGYILHRGLDGMWRVDYDWDSPGFQGFYLPFYDVWANSAFDIYAVGAGGLILHSDGTVHADGSKWRVQSRQSVQLAKIWAPASGTPVFVYGGYPAPALLKSTTPGSWVAVDTGMTEATIGLWGDSADSLWLSGYTSDYSHSIVRNVVLNGAGTCNPFDDQNPCTADSCDASGQVKHDQLADGMPCGGVCLNGGACQAGQCTGGTLVTCSADSCHTAGTCDPVSGCPAPVAKTDGTSCIDNNPCSSGDTCTAGVCGGTSPVCAGEVPIGPVPGLQQLHDAWGTSAGDVYATGVNMILHYSGSAPATAESIPESGYIWKVWGSSPDNLYAVGSGGRVLHKQPGQTSWVSEATGITSDLRGVWGSSSSDVYAVGDGGTILHSTGDSVWSSVATGVPAATARINAIRGSSATEVFAVGDDPDNQGQGFIIHRKSDGSGWETQKANVTHGLNNLWVRGPSDVYAVGSWGGVLHLGSTGGWITEQSHVPNHFGGIWAPPSGTPVYIVGSASVGSPAMLMKSSGFGTGDWTTVTTMGADETLSGLWGDSPTSLWIAGADPGHPIFGGAPPVFRHAALDGSQCGGWEEVPPNPCTADSCDPVLGPQHSSVADPAMCNNWMAIEPRLDAVVDLGASAGTNRYVAVFSYENNSGVDVTLVPGPVQNNVVRNGSSVPTPNPAPPTRFLVGDHPGAFLPKLAAGETLTWKIAGRSLTATTGGPTLTPTPFGTGGLRVTIGETAVVLQQDMAQYAEPPQDPVQTPPDPPPVGDPFNGTLTGQFSVGPTGAAIYTVPISIPPGVAGMAPNLSLVYNSQGGNGIAGQGWEMTGLSMIHRCPKTKAQDGHGRPVVLDELVKSNGDDTDGICLDGQRLFEDPVGSGNYRPERANFGSITRDPTNTYFTVVTKSGETRTYGSRANSRVVAPRGHYDPTSTPSSGSEYAAWALDRSVDAWGNFYDLYYNDSSVQPIFLRDGMFVSRIDYTGHLTPEETDVPPFYSVSFDYEDRIDKRTSRFGGSTLPRKVRLKSITTPRGTYALTYMSDDHMLPSRLQQIKYCAKQDSPTAPPLCMEPLDFDWSWTNLGWDPAPAYAPPASIDVLWNADKQQLSPGTQFVDLDGDGRQDFILAKDGVSAAGCPSGAWRNTGQGWECQPATWKLPANLIKANGEPSAMLADVDGDGLLDLVANSVPNVSAAKVWLNRINQQDGWVPGFTTGVPIFTLDFKYDGMADLNGDGKADVVLGQGHATGILSTGSGWKAPDQGIRYDQAPSGEMTVIGFGDEFALPLGATLSNHHLVDINRDGLVDVVSNVPTTVNGSQVFEAEINTGDPSKGALMYIGGDANSGGTEFVGTVWKHSTFAADPGFEAADPNSWLVPKYRFFPDLDGDGFRDSIRYQPNFFPGAQESDPPVVLSVDAALSLSTGLGYTADGISGYLSELSRVPDNGLNHQIAFTDLNADGLVDLVRKDRTAPFVNTGTSWFEMPEDVETDIPGVPNDTYFYHNGDAFVDLDGDGVMDFVRASSASGSLVHMAWLNKFRPPVIRHFPNALAQKTEALYSVITTAEAQALNGVYSNSIFLDEGTSHLAVPMRVVATVHTASGTGSILTTSYKYRDLRGSTSGRGPQGFRGVEMTEESGLRTFTTYSQVFPFTGLPTSVERSLQGPTTATATTYCYPVSNPDDPPQCVPSSGSQPQPGPGASLFVYPWKIVDTSYLRTSTSPEQVPPEKIDTTTIFSYDGRGNPVHTEVLLEGAGGERYHTDTINIYGAEGSQHERQGKLTESTVTSQRLAPLDGDNQSRVHKTAFVYHTIAGTPALALFEKIVEPGTGVGVELHTTYSYDPFGNVAFTTNCASDFLSCSPGAPGPSDLPFRTTFVSYDPDDFVAPPGTGLVAPAATTIGRFPVMTVNGKNQKEYSVYEPLFGLPKQVTGPNGITTCHSYNKFGRQLSETTGCGSARPLTTTVDQFSTSSDPPFFFRVITVTTPPTGGATWTYSDVLGRDVRKMTAGFGGQWVQSDTEYDGFGRLRGTSKPHFTTELAYWTRTQYDILSRPWQITTDLASLDGTAPGASTVVTMEYQGSTVVTKQTVEGVERSRAEKKNLLGKTASVTDANGIPISFKYDADGNLTSTEDPSHNHVTIGYDVRGRKTSSSDADLGGEWTYHYNGFGDLAQQIAANGVSTTMTYDVLGRMTTRTDPSGTAEWVYDVANGAGLGKLAAIVSPPDARLTGPCSIPHTTLSGGNRTGRSFTYTPFGELLEEKECVDGEDFVTTHDYDDFGRPGIVTYPQVQAESSRLGLEYHYTNLGYLHYLTDVSDGKTYWKAKAMNAAGQVTVEEARNGVETTSNRNPATGWLMGSASTAHANNDTLIQTWAYQFDEAGNLRLRGRSDSVNTADSEETFDYDKLDRLTRSGVNILGVDTSETYVYDALGNLTSKAGKPYTYSGCGAGPHAVCSVNGGAPFVYDEVGSMVSGGGRTIEYTPANRVRHIQGHAFDGSDTDVDFIYGPDGGRVVQAVSGGPGGGSTARTIYVGMSASGKSVYERTARGTTVEHVQFIYAGGVHGGSAFALRVVTSEGPSTTGPATVKYNHFDHLGSITAVSDETGQVVSAAWGGPNAGVMGYDPWGARRNPEGSSADPASFGLPVGHRGFTGHETIPDVGLINMNGRVYDPVLGRFLTPDPNVQFSANLQSYNRYSYVLNNPLRYTDPTGYYSWGALANDLASISLAFAVTAACAAEPGGLGCVILAVTQATWTAGAMLASGASFDQVMTAEIIELAAGQFGGLAGGAIAGDGSNVARVLIGGAVSGMVANTIATPMMGGQLSLENTLVAATKGAASAGAGWAAAHYQPSQAGAAEAQGEPEVDAKFQNGNGKSDRYLEEARRFVSGDRGTAKGYFRMAIEEAIAQNSNDFAEAIPHGTIYKIYFLADPNYEAKIEPVGPRENHQYTITFSLKMLEQRSSDYLRATAYHEIAIHMNKQYELGLSYSSGAAFHANEADALFRQLYYRRFEITPYERASLEASFEEELTRIRTATK